MAVELIDPKEYKEYIVGDNAVMQNYPKPNFSVVRSPTFKILVDMINSLFVRGGINELNGLRETPENSQFVEAIKTIVNLEIFAPFKESIEELIFQISISSENNNKTTNESIKALEKKITSNC